MTNKITAYRRQKPPKLHNELSIDQLKEQLRCEVVPRKTLSFYRYQVISDPIALRNSLFEKWREHKVYGRVYLAKEGINAQISVPEDRVSDFLSALDQDFKGIKTKSALEESESFYKLIVKVRKKIVADGLEDDSFDASNVGTHLDAREFNAALRQEGTVVVDVRNHYESEIGHFKGAIRPDVDSFKEELPEIRKLLKGREEDKVLLYCTGGIRCEKASAWLKHEGFSDVNQLHGGIIDYARQVKEQDLESEFIGKNFVFDARLGERITEDVIANCHQCGEPADSHTNCLWDACHILFIQCDSCSIKMGGCCSAECKKCLDLPEEDQKKLRQEANKVPGFFRSRRRPDGLSNQA